VEVDGRTQNDLMTIEELFFELLQVAIGTRKTLSCMVGEHGRTTPSAEQWAELFALSKKQTLVAICFQGLFFLNRSLGDDDFGASLGIDEIIYLKWLELTARTAL